MKTLLVAINAKYIHSNLAIYSLRAYAKKMGYEVDMAEFTINQSVEYMLKEIYRLSPDFIGFSCYIWNISFVRQLANEVAKILPECKIWFGGPEVSYDCEKVLRENDYLDGIMIGEGEKEFVNVLNAYQNEESLENIDGVAFLKRDVKDFIMNPPKGYINMDEIPFPYKDFKNMEHRIIYYESSRGCPYSCSYCLSSVDKKVRYRSIELVKKELQIFLDEKVPQVKFVDRTFNCDRKRTAFIWQYIKNHDNGITNFHFEISADIITEDEIKLLSTMRPGLVQLEIGVQTTNEKTIDAIRRKMDFGRLSYIVNKIHEPGNVHQHLDLIAGLPYEDYESFEKSFNDVYNLKPQQLQLGFLKVLKGSYMSECAKGQGIVYCSYPPYEVLYTPWLPFSDVLRLKGIEEMVEVYYNSGQFVTTMNYLEGFFENPFKMYEYFSEYYEKNGFFDCGQARITRYEIIKNALNDKAPLVSQTLVHDLYIRENMKSRPSFAQDMDKYKQAARRLYMDEELIRKLLPDYNMYTTKQIERMTHIEHYDVDMAKLSTSGKIETKEVFYLYDYHNISPVDQSARIIDVTQFFIT